MSEVLLGALGLSGLLLLSYLPVNQKIGADTSVLLGTYVLSFFFRALCLGGAFLNGARMEVVVAIIVSVALETVVLVRIGAGVERAESLA